MTSELTAPGAELYCPSCEQQFAFGELCPDDGTRLVRLGTTTDPLIGRDLDGRYTIIEKLGEGGMGAVYRARQHSMGREVAIKVVSPAYVSDAQSIKRFLREAKLASRLSHPNVVSVLDFGQATDGVFYLVMELVTGRTLHDAIANEAHLSLARLIRIGSQICDALEGAHQLPIIHRDLKPANVMLLATGRDLVKVLDFGLAKSLSPDGTGTTMTSAGALLGTPTFMPPEVANGDPVDARADLYSLGCILYVMGTGRPPFVTDSIPEMIAMHGTEPAPPMTGVPVQIGRVVDRLLRKNPAERYPSAAAVREALESAYEQSRTQGMFADTADGRLPPAEARIPLDLPTTTSEPPQRLSELRVTSLYTTPAPTTGERVPAAALPARAHVAPTAVNHRRSRSVILGTVVAVLAVAAVTLLALYAHDDAAPSTSAPAASSEGAGTPPATPAAIAPATTSPTIDAAVPDVTTPEKTATEKTATEKTATEKTATEKTTPEKVTGEKATPVTTTEKTTPEKATGEKTPPVRTTPGTREKATMTRPRPTTATQPSTRPAAGSGSARPSDEKAPF